MSENNKQESEIAQKTETKPEFNHVSVLLSECIENLNINPNGLYMDGTAGGAGHSFEIARRLTGEGGMLFAFDRDPTAVNVATGKLKNLHATVIQNNFMNAAKELKALGINGLDGALLDLGVSSHQLDEKQRGFSYSEDAPLDMRMSSSGKTAADIVNSASREELAAILREYGEEKNAWNIAGKICTERESKPILTTLALVDCVLAATPPAIRRKQKNPARKTFQAIRIAVNEELDSLSKGLDEIFEILNTGGRFCIITFHSIEDRIVKQRFKTWATSCVCPPEFPVCVCENKAKAKIITKKPIEPSENEINANRRARSAKLRVIEKL